MIADINSNEHEMCIRNGREVPVVKKNEEIIGLKFGNLLVIEAFPKIKLEYRKYKCLCICGNEVVVNRGSLITGNTSSCGCIIKEILIKRNTRNGNIGRFTNDGKKPIRAYNSWKSMIDRCMNKRCQNYHNYGGRGIKVTDVWMIFENFYKDMGSPPDGFTIERINNNGNYEPSNCKWVSKDDQCRNKRSNRFLTYKGETKTLIEWSEILGLPYYTLHGRLRRGWTAEKTLSEPIN